MNGENVPVNWNNPKPADLNLKYRGCHWDHGDPMAARY